MSTLGSWAHTCVHHTDAERLSSVACPVCATAEIATLRAEVERLTGWLADPHALHAHCLRTLTDGQIAHLFGERMTAIVNRAETAEAECLEQARLLGMSGSREAELLGKLERAERALARYELNF